MADLTLYFFRHGESLANQKRVFAARKIDPPLTEKGIEEVKKRAESLKDIDFSAVYASSLLRARQTAEIFSQRYGFQIELSDDLQEVDVGILDGKSQDDLENRRVYNEIIGKWENGLINIGFPDGETLKDVGDRFRRFLGRLESEQQNRVLIIGHCLFFMAVIWLFCENHGPRFEDAHMERGHLSVIKKVGDRFRLVHFNISPEVSLQDILLWKGVVIAEGLSDPTVINKLSVCKAEITKDGIPIDYEGNLGRWHIYYVRCSREGINRLQSYILHGWYAHFWNEDKLIVVYNDKQFELARHDKATWKEATGHGKSQGIPENELGFPTD